MPTGRLIILRAPARPAWGVVRLFDGYHVTFVGVHVSDAEGARREILRGDRHAG